MCLHIYLPVFLIDSTVLTIIYGFHQQPSWQTSISGPGILTIMHMNPTNIPEYMEHFQVIHRLQEQVCDKHGSMIHTYI